MAAKKQLTAAQGMDAACILFELNSKREHIVNLAFGAEIPEACLTEPGAPARLLRRVAGLRPRHGHGRAHAARAQ